MLTGTAPAWFIAHFGHQTVDAALAIAAGSWLVLPRKSPE